MATNYNGFDLSAQLLQAIEHFVSTLGLSGTAILTTVLTGLDAATTGTVSAADTLLVALGKLQATKAVPGKITVVPLTTHTLLATDLGTKLEQQSTSALTLSIDTVANSGIAWVPGSLFLLGSQNTGTVTLTALSGVTITNIGTKTVVQDDTPLVVEMSRTTNKWLVL